MLGEDLRSQSQGSLFKSVPHLGHSPLQSCMQRALIKKLKTIVDCYSENVTVESLLGTCYEISDFTYDNLKSIINKPDFLIRFKTKEFKINLSKGTSSYQMNIYFHKN